MLHVVSGSLLLQKSPRQTWWASSLRPLRTHSVPIRKAETDQSCAPNAHSRSTTPRLWPSLPHSSPYYPRFSCIFQNACLTTLCCARLLRVFQSGFYHYPWEAAFRFGSTYRVSTKSSSWCSYASWHYQSKIKAYARCSFWSFYLHLRLFPILLKFRLKRLHVLGAAVFSKTHWGPDDEKTVSTLLRRHRKRKIPPQRLHVHLPSLLNVIKARFLPPSTSSQHSQSSCIIQKQTE